MHKVRTQNLHSSAQQSRIVAAAIDLFEQHGYTQTSLSRIASAVNMTQPALYYYFDGKLAILESVVRFYNTAFDEFYNSLSRGPGGPVERLRRILHGWVIYEAENASVLRTVQREERHVSPEFRKRLVERDRRILSDLEQLYADGVKHGAFRDTPPRAATLLLIGACISVREWFRADGPLTSEEIAGIIVSMLMRSVTVDA